MNADETLKVLKAVADYLDGKKTHIVGIVAIGYIFGGSMGWWPIDNRIIELLGFGGLMALRSGVAKTGQ